MEKTVRWYVDTLGAHITFEGEIKGSKVNYFEISGFNFIVTGQLDDENGEDSPLDPTLRSRFGLDHFGFAVEDMAEALEDLRAQGVNILMEPWSPREGLIIAYIEGPDNVRIELTKRE